jgi:hypothetical protein
LWGWTDVIARKRVRLNPTTDYETEHLVALGAVYLPYFWQDPRFLLAPAILLTLAASLYLARRIATLAPIVAGGIARVATLRAAPTKHRSVPAHNRDRGTPPAPPRVAGAGDVERGHDARHYALAATGLAKPTSHSGKATPLMKVAANAQDDAPNEHAAVK